jgi:hypothetical protein
MRKLCILIACCLATVLYAQEQNREFGKVTAQELRMEYYNLDKEAEAVVLYDLGKMYFQHNSYGGFDAVFERHVKIKIFSEAGIDWGQIDVLLYRDGRIYETVESFKGITSNLENGHLVQTSLDPANKYKEKVNEYYDKEKYALPNVKPGSVIEFSYKTTSQYIFRLKDWKFQHRIPVVFSELQVKMIPFYGYVFLLQGTDKFDYQESYTDAGPQRQFGPIMFNDMVYRFVMNNVPAFKDEAFISSYDDYVIQLGFQLSETTNFDGTKNKIITTWEELIKELLIDEEFGKYIKSATKNAKKTVPALQLSGKSEAEKLEALVTFVKEKYTWNGRNSYFAYQKFKDFEKKKEGNSAEINLYLLALCQTAGLNAHPVILSTRDHGKIKMDYPFAIFFNYVLVQTEIEGKQILSDARSNLYAYDKIPLNCINDRGLVVNKGSVEWVGLANQGAESGETSSLAFEWTENLEKVTCDLTLLSSGYKGAEMKHKFGESKEKVIKHLAGLGYGTSDEVVFENYSDPKKEFIIKTQITAPVEHIEGKIYIAPFLNQPPAENIFKQSSRTNPIDMVYTSTQSFRASLPIPEGYKVSYRPKDLRLDNKYYNIAYAIEEKDGQLEVTAHFGFKYAVFTADAYNLIKYLYAEIVKLMNDRIVLEKSAV